MLHELIQAVDEVYISDDYKSRYAEEEEAFVIKHEIHAFKCTATNPGQDLQMRWELFDGTSGVYVDHDDGYPKAISLGTLGQVKSI